MKLAAVQLHRPQQHVALPAEGEFDDAVGEVGLG
jgi:hypothetical protein